MKNIIKELENKKYSCYQDLMAGTIGVKEYLNSSEKIDQEIKIASKAITWLSTPENNQRTVAKRKFNYLRFSAIALLIFILFSFVTTTASTKKTMTTETTTESIKIITNFPKEQEDMQSHEETQPKTEWVSLGTFITSGYCNESYYHMCNDGTADTTATMTIPTAGRTIAVDPRVIPYGSEVMINGHTYIAEDCGSAIKGKRIDILYDNHDIAFAHGMQEVEVFIKINN